MQGGPVQNNLRGLFQQLSASGHELVNHQWRPREQFLELCATMDIGMQCNFSETFNIVSADLISQGVPIMGTANEIPWAVHAFCADPVDSKDMVDKLELTYNWSKANVLTNQFKLKAYTNTLVKEHS
jgi:hypothetical protein